MDLIITWGTIGKLALTGVITYVIAPALLIIRDWLLWKAIEKFILNDHLRTLISMRANDVWYLNNKYNHQREIKFGQDKDDKHYLNAIEVSPEEFEKIDKAIKFHGNRADKAGATIVWRSNFVNWVLKHYKLEPTSNPIPKWEERAYLQKEESVTNKPKETSCNG